MTFTYKGELPDNLILLRKFKSDAIQHDVFFYQGHPNFYIPDFSDMLEDIWTSYLTYLETSRNLGENNLWDQEGGEITEHKVIDPKTGLTRVKYEAHGIQLTEQSEVKDHVVLIEGYVVEYFDPDAVPEVDPIEDGIFTCFVATKVEENN